MKNTFVFAVLLFSVFSSTAQVMTPEKLWELGRVSANGISADGSQFVYTVTTPNIQENSFDKVVYTQDIKSGALSRSREATGLLPDTKISPSGDWKLVTKNVKVKNISGKDYYPNLSKSNAYVFDELHFRHWDEYEDGEYGHVFLEKTDGSKSIDLMEGEPYDVPTKPFGGDEDYVWSPDGKYVVYVSKKYFGTDYVTTTNTDLFRYEVGTGKTVNLTSGNPGYDTHPAYSADGKLAYLSMAREGYESDKNDIIIRQGENRLNLTGHWDGTVDGFIWSKDNTTLYFTAPVMGTAQLYKVEVPKDLKGKAEITKITDGTWNITDLVGEVDGGIIAGRTDMNHAKEYYIVDVSSGKMEQLTHVNDAIFSSIKKSRVEAQMIATTDGKEMLTWIIYPPDFDPSKKYPTLLYAQGGPQSALNQFYSYRWNFQVMAAQGYIVVAPNRRGMPGYGVEWNEQISKDWGGQNMRDYLSAIDAVAKEPFVDKERLGCVGASYGGYSTFYLAGIHENRFKSFIAHDGIFNLRSMYGSTEELFFVNWDIGGPYWESENEAAQRAYRDFNPINLVSNWNTPILIIQGGRDYRVPEGQAFEAFTAAQMLGIKSRLLYFPEENHWVLKPQNGLVWQSEFFRWLSETLKQE